MKRLNIDTDDLIKRYLAGESEKAAADRLGVSRTPIRRILLEGGVVPRGRRDAEILKWSKASPEIRRRQTEAANRAARGRSCGFDELCRKAYARQIHAAVTGHEARLATFLISQGLDVSPQQAIGPYNCDLGIHPVAVEVFGGGWHFYGRHLARTPKRIRYLMDRGWSVLMVVVEKRRGDITIETASHVASYVDLVRSDPSRRPEYRMIRSTGELMTAGSSDDNEASIMATFCRRKNFARGYQRISR